mmetsp:Transcript_20702/g.33331  ORF Transcript_20702/g.33331 Transcript_20702/m.33331 type:complete len:501 (+) Transcript_20702:273-1775(+)|eukprot:CAMPEP_0178739626 /NCGR_PEP_ID=MMETSP0744-20121128/4158_1 /TAXON_ID=913974 /ORGANISM="Nitzschia punctata, Strain CCMP561" /LENGTH=500 /DNA_ID=CAMNT_0020392347 /DNA_START=246 /DNA_END=1748 /DNA_ORIENTATION=-
MENSLNLKQSVPLCCAFAAIGGALEVAATAVTAVPAVREKEGILMNKWIRWLSIFGNLILQGAGSIVGHLVATWFGPVSLVVPFFFSATLLCNLLIVGILREPFTKNMRVGTLVIVVSVILLPIVGPTTQDDQNFMLLMEHWYSQAWFLLLLFASFTTGILVAKDVTKYSKTNRMIILLAARASSLCVNLTVSRAFILGPKGRILAILIAIKLVSGSLYSAAIIVQSVAVDQSRFVPLNATLIMLVNALTGIIIWQEWNCVQSWLGYLCVFALLGLACDLLLSVPLLNSENPKFGLNKRVSSIMPVNVSNFHTPLHFSPEDIQEMECEDDSVDGECHDGVLGVVSPSTPLSKAKSRISRAEAWREIVSPIASSSARAKDGSTREDDPGKVLQPGGFANTFGKIATSTQDTGENLFSTTKQVGDTFVSAFQLMGQRAAVAPAKLGNQAMETTKLLGNNLGSMFREIGGPSSKSRTNTTVPPSSSSKVAKEEHSKTSPSSPL